MPAPLLIAGLAAGGFIKGGGLQGVLGGRARRREEQAARREQRERQFEYENFDFNQDVGDIYNPYAQQAAQTQDFLQENLDQTQANLLRQHQQAGSFGATTGVLAQSQRAAEQSAQRVNAIRATGNRFVEQQRQARIAKRYDQAGTFLARADSRLAEAKRARTRATEKLFSGIGAGITAGAGAAAGGLTPGGGFDIGGALEGSGLLPEGVGSKLGGLATNRKITNQVYNDENLAFDDYGDGTGYYNLDDLDL